MIVPANSIELTYSELESLFSAALNKEIKEWKSKKDEFIKNPFNNAVYHHIPTPEFRIWVTVSRKLVNNQTARDLIKNIRAQGWTINKCEWLHDERTGADQMFFVITQ